VDTNSGVSARLPISAYENLYSTVERRLLINNEDKAMARVSDLYGVIPSITGKVELVYEGEQEGPMKIAQILISKAIRTEFINYFPSPEKLKRSDQVNPYQEILDWFNQGNSIDLMVDDTEKEHRQRLQAIPGLQRLVQRHQPKRSKEEQTVLMEFALHGLAEYSFLNKYRLEKGLQFRDMLSGMFSEEDAEDEGERYREAF
jgi:magnesium chelatase subunit I